jgi:hypothetical protein
MACKVCLVTSKGDMLQFVPWEQLTDDGAEIKNGHCVSIHLHSLERAIKQKLFSISRKN